MKTDEQLRHDVERELEFDPIVDARNIAVTAKNGVVTLTGVCRLSSTNGMPRTLRNESAVSSRWLAK